MKIHDKQSLAEYKVFGVKNLMKKRLLRFYEDTTCLYELTDEGRKIGFEQRRKRG